MISTRLNVIRTLKASNNSETLLVRKIGNGDIFILKKLPPLQDNLVDSFDRITSVENPNIISPIQSYPLIRNEKGTYIPLPYYINGSLAQLLDKMERGIQIPEWDSTAQSLFAYKLACAIKFLHSKQIVHGYLHPSNILISFNYEPIITDYWNALFKDPKLLHIQCSNSLLDKPSTNFNMVFIAPEIPNSFTEASDTYSFGLIIYALLFKETLSTKRELLIKPYSSELSNLYSRLIERCLAYKPIARPDMKFIPYLMIMDHLVFPGANPSLLDKFMDDLKETEKMVEKTISNERNDEKSNELSDFEKLLDIYPSIEKPYHLFSQKTVNQIYHSYLTSSSSCRNSTSIQGMANLYFALRSPANSKEAFDYARKAAHLKIPEAEYISSILASKHHSYEIVIPLLENAVSHHYPPAIYSYAIFILKHVFLPNPAFVNTVFQIDIESENFRGHKGLSYEKIGIAILHKAAEYGSIPAHIELGLIYLNGEITTKNIEIAKNHLKIAADHGYPNIQEKYGALVNNITYMINAINQGYGSSTSRKKVASLQTHLNKFLISSRTQVHHRLQNIYAQSLTKRSNTSHRSFINKNTKKNQKTKFNKVLLKSTAQNDPISAFQYAEALFSGNGFAKNIASSAQWYRIAAKEGNVDAMYALWKKASQLRLTIDEGLDWLKKAAFHNHILALHSIGVLLLKSLDETERRDGKRFLQQAASNGHAESFYILSNIEPNREHALDLLKISAQLGFAQAKAEWGSYLLNKRKNTKALEFLNSAADGENALAQEVLGDYYIKNKQETAAISRYNQAVHQGSITAMIKLGKIYLDTKKSEEMKKGSVLLRRAAEMGSIEAMEMYGQFLLSETNIEKDYILGTWFLNQAKTAIDATK